MDVESQRQVAFVTHGPCHVVVSRVVSGEETISVELFGGSYPDLAPQVVQALADLRQHMIAHNEQVVLATNSKVEQLNAEIVRKGSELNQLRDEVAQLEKRRGKLTRVG